MARKRRRKKIRASQAKGRRKLEKQFESLKDIQTVAGQALCDADQFCAGDERMMVEEVIISHNEAKHSATSFSNEPLLSQDGLENSSSNLLASIFAVSSIVIFIVYKVTHVTRQVQSHGIWASLFCQAILTGTEACLKEAARRS